MTTTTEANVTTREIGLKMLPVPLSQDEIEEKAKALARAEVDLRKLKDKQNADNKINNGKKKEFQNEINELAESVNSGTEDQEVECSMRYLWDEGVVEVVRNDTNEVVSERAIEEAERQMYMEHRDEEND